MRAIQEVASTAVPMPKVPPIQFSTDEHILRENANINPENLTAAGRGEYAPIATNDTAEGKAKNRRIEVILTPKLDELTKLLSDI